MHPVRVYKGHPDHGGKVVKEYSRETLEKRADIQFLATHHGHLNKPVTERICVICEGVFWSNVPGAAACPGVCLDKHKNIKSIARAKERKAKGDTQKAGRSKAVKSVKKRKA